MNSDDNSGHWYRLALSIAVVAGVFSITVGVLLLTNYINLRISDPLNSKELAELRALLYPQSGEERIGDVGLSEKDIKEKIQELDLQLREEYFRRREFSRFGSYLILCGVAIFLLIMRSAMAFRKRLPMPQPVLPDEETRSATMARRAVSVFGLVALGVALALIALDTDVKYRSWSARDSETAFQGESFPTEVGTPNRVQDSESVPQEQVISTPQQQETDAQYPSVEDINRNWPRFRGPGGLGISQYTNVPASWNGKTGEGILWKTAIPLPGKNSPVVWGDRVFLTGANEEEREVYCFDANSGKLLWERAVVDVPFSEPEPPEVAQDTGFAAPTAVVDGKRVYGIFANGDFICFDFDGNRIWARSLGPFESMYGYASSLLMYQNLVIVLLDQGDAEAGISEIIAVEASSGKTVWETDRPVPNSWATPIIIDTGQRKEIITSGSPWVISYDPATGKELWRAECLGGDIAPSPVYGGGLVFVTNSYEVLAAIRPGGEGNVTDTHIVWTAEDGLPDICSPLTNGELVFLIETYGFMTCYDAKDGKKVWEHDLGETFIASPGLVGNNIYMMTEDGITIILEAGREFKEVGRYELGERTEACPAFLDGRIYIRGEENLYCIGN